MELFISYRRSDAPSAARQLADALKLRLGAEHAFFDTRDIVAGAEWRNVLLERVRAADVVLVVIGAHWATSAADRASRRILHDDEEDVLRLEVENAFTHGATVLPILVDGAQMPPRATLPRPFRPLADLQAHILRHDGWDDDVEALADTVAGLHPRPRSPLPPRATPPSRRELTGAERMARYLADGGVVTVLGTHLNTADRDVGDGNGAAALPDATELARRIADRFGVEPATEDLAWVSQQVAMDVGRLDLSRALRELLASDAPPNSVHRFLACLPGRLAKLGKPRGQLILTANFDTALERAFDAVREPYDLVVYIARGEHRGRFLHVPWWDRDGEEYRHIQAPNDYVELPIDEYGECTRTVIVKLHGGPADLGAYAHQLRDNFVVTEDDYIGYLTQSPVERLIPLQILQKIRDSHFLFLGYPMRDWNVRVFIHRVWFERRLEARSSTVEPGLSSAEREHWEHLGVDVHDVPVPAYLEELERALPGRV